MQSTRNRQAEMEVQDESSGDVVARGGRRGRIFRELRRQLLCGGCCHGQTEMEVSDRRRAALRRQASARRRAGCRDDARSFDFYLSSPAFGRAGLLRQRRRQRVCPRCQLGNAGWKFQTGDVVHASPAIADGTLYVGSWDSYFYASMPRPERKWRFKTGEDPDTHNQVGIQSSAVVADGVVYFGCRDSNLYALDAKTGEKRWVFNNKGSWVIVAGGEGRQGVLRQRRTPACSTRWTRKLALQEFSMNFSLADVFLACDCGQHLYIGSTRGN